MKKVQQKSKKMGCGVGLFCKFNPKQKLHVCPDVPGYNEEEARTTAAQKVPLGRSGERLEMARLAVFLCSEDAGYILGKTIIADGGTTSLMSLITDFRVKSTATFGVSYVPGL